MYCLKKIVILLVITTFAFPQKVYIHAGRLIDGITEIPVEMVTIIINGSTIQSILRGHINPQSESDKLINLKDYTLLPGLMDMHTHLSGESNPKSYMEKFYMDLDEYAYRSIPYAEKTLMAGFTTVRELGGVISNSLRDAIRSGYVVGPRIFSAGKAIATTGGHADPTNGMSADEYEYPTPEDGVINGPYEAFTAVRQRYKDGADGIKLTVTGGVLSVAKSGDNPQFTKEEIDAVVEAAKDAVRQLCERAAKIWEVDAEGVIWENGHAKPASTNVGDFEPLSLANLAAQAPKTGGPICGHNAQNVQGAGPGFATHICDVEVDPETGSVSILRYTAIQDVGRAIHPSYVEGQIQGGAAQGIGWALNEEYIYNSKGQLDNPGFLDYRIPVASDLPMIDAVMVEVPNDRHPYGVRGVGEVPIVPPMAAVANAIENATGVRMSALPMSPPRLLAALDQADIKEAAE